MKTVILCGGLGSRLAEETQLKPKPMVEIGGRPILWHIMMIYARHGVKDFMLALGYKSEVIKVKAANQSASSLAIKNESAVIPPTQIGKACFMSKPISIQMLKCRILVLVIRMVVAMRVFICFKD